MKKKNILSIVCAAGAMTLVSSCGLYTPYSRPDISFADSLYRPLPCDSLYADSVSVAAQSWKSFFTDPQLQQWIETGLKNNADLNVAHLRTKQAEAALQASRQAFLPSLDLSVEGSVSKKGSAAAAKGYSIGPSAAWEVDLFGKLTNEKRGAQAALLQSDAYRQAVQIQVISGIANAYYTLLMLDEQLRISQYTLITMKENVRTLAALKTAGKTNEAAVLQAKANQLSVEGNMKTLKRQIAEQEHALCGLLGITPQTIERGKLDEQNFPEKLSLGIPLKTLANRPDVREAEYSLMQAYYATNTVRADFYPQLTLSGSLGWTNGSGLAVTNPGSWLLNALGSLVQPLFQKGQNRANLKIAQAQQEEALLLFRQSLLDAGIEVNDALMQWQTARERIDVDREQISLLRAAVWNTRLLMKHGQVNYLEVLIAQQNLLQAELTGAEDKYDEIQGVITLYHALGGGLS